MSRKTSLRLLPLVVLTLLGFTLPLHAQVSGLRGDLIADLNESEDKILQLAQAIPQEKYGWSPEEGVRSTGEVLAHIAAANYYLLSLAGVKPPEGVDPMSFEKKLTTRDDLVAALKKSFDWTRKVITDMPDSALEDKVSMFGHDTTKRGALLALTGHSHEHLGQLIAYARSNGVTPPWSK